MKIILLLIVTFLCIFFMLKYFRLKNKVKKLLDEYNKPLRRGFYISDAVQERKVNDTVTKVKYYAYIYVSEIERYKNDISKVSLDDVEIVSEGTMNYDHSIKFIKDTFKSVVKTSEITWLDTEEDLKELRKQKLEKLKNLYEK